VVLRDAHGALEREERVRGAEVCHAAKSDLAPGALFHYAAALERLSDEKASAAAYERLRARFPKHTLADDAGFFLIRHALDDLKDWKAARALAEKLVAEHPEGDMVGEAVFFVASAAMADERWRDAQAVLRLNDKLPPPFFTDHDAGRTEYWRARVAQQMKMPLPGIVEGYESVFKAMPMGWYSLLAYSRLRELDPERARAAVLQALATDPARADVPGGPGETWSFAVPPGFAPPALETAIQLARLGLAQPARDALEAAASAETPETLWFSAWVLDRAGAYRYSHDLLRRKLKNYRTFGATGAQSRIWRMAFPAPYRELVTLAETNTGVPAAFVWGIMREESGFNPGVESSANAVGLMQLILPTAKRMAALTPEDEGTVTLATLTDPRVSVRLGARYLQHVLDQVGGRAALPVLPAGYNAGEGALKRWLKARGDMPLDLFVEHMTFEEARWYTKRVVSSYATYRFLYFGGDADRDPLPYFPQKLPR
jgi:soluble lytic murein transglycosylase